MSLRLVGAVLALLAAVLLAASIVTSAWWSGHPEVDGRAVKNKTVYIGLLGSEGCNTGGDGKCAPLVVASEFTTVGYVELGATGLLLLLAVALGIATLKSSEPKKFLARIVIVSALIASATAATMIMIGPNIKSTHTVAVPMGYGMWLFWAAVGSAILGSVLAMQPPPKVKLRPSRQPSALPQPSAAPQIDVLALLQEDALRPSALGPEPMVGRPPMPPSPGGALAGPAGPLGVPATQSQPPLFSGAPQLRALYDANPAHGGTSGYVPGALPPLPTEGPTPVRRSQVGAIAGIPTPPPMQSVPRGDTLADALENLPPPKPSPALPPPGTRTKAASVVPPPVAKPPALTPPSIGRATPPKPQATIATPVVPPPLTVPGVMPDLAKKIPIRHDTDPSDHMETIDQNAMTMEREIADVMIGSPAPNKVTAKGTAVAVGDSTDAQINLPAEESTDVNAQAIERPGTDSDDRETKARDKVDPDDIAPPPRPSENATLARAKVDTPSAVAAVARDSASEIETIARERISARELETGDSTSPEGAAARGKTPVPIITQAGVVARTKTPAPVPASEGRKTPVPIVTQPGVVPPDKKSAPKIPLSTASESLPPPKEAKPQSVGPTPACPQCEAPMAWVEEHLRFYCKTCRMYF